MTNPRNGIAGFQFTEHTWITEVGNWIDAISPDGRRAGALLFDAEDHRRCRACATASWRPC